MPLLWEGRLDGEEALYHRIFQRVTVQNNVDSVKPGNFVLHGYATDKGVLLNKGRTGARNAPDIIRKNMANFPVTSPDFMLIDFGNISADDVDFSVINFQNQVRDRVAKILAKGAKSIVLGGGHDIMYGHFSGIRKAFPDKKIGIINIDAHFDNRELDPDIGPTSGTGFWQIAQEEKIHSLHIGIQRNSNTLKLFDTAHQYGMKYILADEIFFENLPNIYEKIDEFSNEVDLLYITICMDVFNAAIAPGVSALAYSGIFADAAFMHFYRHILKSEKLVALDVAEVNPEFDIQERTARLAASLVNEWFLMG